MPQKESVIPVSTCAPKIHCCAQMFNSMSQAMAVNIYVLFFHYLLIGVSFSINLYYLIVRQLRRCAILFKFPRIMTNAIVTCCNQYWR